MGRDDTSNQPGGRHGERSDAKQQGKEEAEGRAQQEEEGRPRPVVVRSGAARAARPEPLWQEGLASREAGRAARRDRPGKRVRLRNRAQTRYSATRGARQLEAAKTTCINYGIAVVSQSECIQSSKRPVTKLTRRGCLRKTNRQRS